MASETALADENELASAETGEETAEESAPVVDATEQSDVSVDEGGEALTAAGDVPAEADDEPAQDAAQAEEDTAEEPAEAEEIEAEADEAANPPEAIEEVEDLPAEELTAEAPPGPSGEAGDEAAAEEPLSAEEAEAEAPPPEPDDGRAWYVVHCYSGDEEKVKHNLEQRTETMEMSDRIFQVVVPTEDEIEIRNGKRRTVERRVFPGYILVQMLLTDDSWYVVRNTPGVTGFVGMGNEPTPLRPEEVQAIVRRMEVEAPKIKVTFKPGQKVRIIDGPFNEFIGVVDEIDMERAKVRVLVSFFGRETPVELDFLQVEKT
jgi:transcriptional antiterminator NusG